MTNTVQIKRSTATAVPPSLALGELAYSGNGGAANGKLYIGDPNASAVTLIGGAYVANLAINALPSASFTAAAVMAMAMTGFSSSAGTLASTDTLITGINKLDGNIALRMTTSSFTDAAVTGKLLTGYVSGAGTVAATDTILQGINKLNGNIAAKLDASSFTDAAVTGKLLTGYSSGAGTVAATDTILQAINKLNGNDGLKVTSIAVTTANGVSGTSSGTTTPSLTISLGAITPTSCNGLTLVAQATGFTIAGGTSSKTLTMSNTLTFAGTDASTLNIGTGGTLGTAAYTAASAYYASTVTLNNIAAPTGTLSMNTQKISNLLDPTSAQDAATKNYVDLMAAGIDVKASCRAATTTSLPAYTRSTNVITATSNVALGVIDGVTLIANDRLLLKNGASASDNGLYVVTAVGSGAAPYVLTRTTDSNTSAQMTTGSFTFIEEGTVNSSTGWILSTVMPITLNSTSLTFVQFSGAGSYTGTTNSITLTGNAFSVSTGYTGGTSIASVGTVTAGTWNAGIIAGTYGGSGVNNGATTFTRAGNIAFTGAYNISFTVPGAYTYTLPAATMTLLGDSSTIDGGSF